MILSVVILVIIGVTGALDLHSYAAASKTKAPETWYDPHQPEPPAP